MQITHLTGTTVETKDLPDVDSFLLEETYKLYANYAKYNRQLFIMGEVRATTDVKSPVGCFFVHSGYCDSKDKSVDRFNEYLERIDSGVMSLTNGMIGLAKRNQNGNVENNN